MNQKKLKQLQSRFNVSCSLFSKIDLNKTIPKVLIIDQIGLLASLYSFSDIAFIGGGFSGQLHNILEAGAKGNVILFGPKTDNMQKRINCKEKVGYKIKDSSDLKNVILDLLSNKKLNKNQTKKSY